MVARIGSFSVGFVFPEFGGPSKAAHLRGPTALCRSRIRRRRFISCTTRDEQKQQQLNLSVLRFTLGIPGLDESYLPRYIGLSFGSLVVLNHFLSSSITPAQLRSEALGLCLAAFSAGLPYIGKFLEGTSSKSRQSVPEGNNQLFIMSEDLCDVQKEDMAWASYVMLRNTNSISVLIAVNDAFCIRGYWSTPEDIPKGGIVDLFRIQIQKAGLLDLRDSLYFPDTADFELRKILPKGTLSVLVQPIFISCRPSKSEQNKGLLLLASNSSYAYSDKDRSWIRAIADKFEDFIPDGRHNVDGSLKS